MQRFRSVLALLILGPMFGFAQSREEIVKFIVDEYKSFEKRERIYNEIQFSPQGDSFRLIRSTKAHNKATVVFQLKDVDIYRVVHNKADGVNQFQLLVGPRGREASLQANGKKALEPLPLTPRTRNGMKCLALERAFTRLTALTTDRKFLFYDPFK